MPWRVEGDWKTTWNVKWANACGGHNHSGKPTDGADLQMKSVSLQERLVGPSIHCCKEETDP